MTLRIKPRAFASQTVRGFSYSLFLVFPSILPFPRGTLIHHSRPRKGRLAKSAVLARRVIESREKRGFARHFLFRTTFGVRHSFTPLSAVNFYCQCLPQVASRKIWLSNDRGHLTAALSSKAWSLTVLYGCAPSPFSARVNYFYDLVEQHIFAEARAKPLLTVPLHAARPSEAEQRPAQLAPSDGQR